jgi:phage terminase small subunit
MKKLSKKEIQEGMKAVPRERILLGANPSNLRLTKKQKTFAEQFVETGNKSEAYRRAYDTKGKRETHARDAQKVANNPNVATYANALQMAKEAEEYLLPTRLRTVAIHRLTKLALDDDVAPAQQLKALELIGKMTEVALFSERREVVHQVDSSAMRDRLMESIRLAIMASNTIEAKTKRSAQSLLAEITGTEPVDVMAREVDADSRSIADGGEGCEIPESDPPHGGMTPFSPASMAGHLHSISDIQSPVSDSELPSLTSVNGPALTNVNGGEGVQNSGVLVLGEDVEMAPLDDLNKKG